MEGPVKCWGDTEFGQIGGAKSHDHAVVITSGTRGSPLNAGEQAVRIAAGGDHTCAILNDGNVIDGGPIKCWGDTGFALFGIGTNGSVLSAGEQATHIAAWSSHTCAILNDKTVKCWGKDSNFASHNETPLSILEKAIDIAVTGEQMPKAYACAILDDGDVSDGGPIKCWDNEKEGSSNPLTTGEQATHIALGLRHACAILDDGDVSDGGPVKCWGENRDGQVGQGGNSFDCRRTGH